MTPHDLHALESSWRHAEPIAETVVRLFYRRLFQTVPELRDRFQTSMCEQSDHLLEATQGLVSRCRGEDEPLTGVVSGVEEFGEQGEAVVEAWLWALEQEIGRCASEGARDAWREAIQSDAGAEFRLTAVGELALIAG